MTAVGLDTSVVLRLLVGEPKDQAQAALRFLELCYGKQQIAYVSDLVVGESYHALCHHYQVPAKEAADSLLAFLYSPMITCTGHALTVLQEYTDTEPGLADRLIRKDYLDQASEIVTFDKRFSRLPNMKKL